MQTSARPRVTVEEAERTKGARRPSTAPLHSRRQIVERRSDSNSGTRSTRKGMGGRRVIAAARPSSAVASSRPFPSASSRPKRPQSARPRLRPSSTTLNNTKSARDPYPLTDEMRTPRLRQACLWCGNIINRGETHTPGYCTRSKVIA